VDKPTRPTETGTAPAPRRRRRQRGQSVTEFALVLPILLALMLGVIDFARLFNTMISVEAAAREAADYSTLYPWQWDPAGSPSNIDKTVAGMRARACAAVKHLPEFQGSDDNCTNPNFSYVIDAAPAGVNANQCHTVPRLSTPCNITVTLTYTFDMVTPVSIIGLPNSLTFQRSSTFAISDFEIDVQ
jgi:Flp pilus assembly protein TadG